MGITDNVYKGIIAYSDASWHSIFFSDDAP